MFSFFLPFLFGELFRFLFLSLFSSEKEEKEEKERMKKIAPKRIKEKCENIVICQKIIFGIKKEVKEQKNEQIN